MRGHKGIDRCKIDDSFGSTIAKLEKNMRNALSNVQKGFSDREKKLEEKIDSLIRNEKKELQNRLKDNVQLSIFQDDLIQSMEALQSKITAIVD